MKQIVVLSGKGGTGKTTVTAALAHLAARRNTLVLADADVDAPNLELLLHPDVEEETAFIAGKRATIVAERCISCGLCEQVCRYDAVSSRGGLYVVEPTACEGCATCFYQCPKEAIEMEPCEAGRWFRSRSRFGPFFHALLYPGEENSGKLVSLIRQQALALGFESKADWLIVDGPPGIGCPVIAAVGGADLALMVAEPTVSGVHDLERALEVAAHFGVPAAVCINKSDLHAARRGEIVAHCASQAIPVLAEIPYDEAVTRAMRQGLTITEASNEGAAAQIGTLWQGLQELIGDG